MKKNQFLRLFIFLYSMFGFVSSTYATNNPIPGVDIIVEKNPGGGAIKATTDRTGTTLLKLEKGAHSISLLNVKKDRIKVDITLTVEGEKLSKRTLIISGADMKKTIPITLKGNGLISISIYDQSK